MTITLPPSRILGDSGHVTDHATIRTALSDLDTAVAAKAPLASPTFTGTVTLPANTVGLAVKQVKSVTTSAAFSTSSTSYVDWTGLTLSITPSSASNKILVMVNAAAQTTAGGVALYVAAIRTSTTIAETYNTSPGNGYFSALTVSYLDSPNTTSATTYKVQAKTGNGSYAFAAVVNMMYTLTVMEVAP